MVKRGDICHAALLSLFYTHLQDTDGSNAKMAMKIFSKEQEFLAYLSNVMIEKEIEEEARDDGDDDEEDVISRMRKKKCQVRRKSQGKGKGKKKKKKKKKKKGNDDDDDDDEEKEEEEDIASRMRVKRKKNARKRRLSLQGKKKSSRKESNAKEEEEVKDEEEDENDVVIDRRASRNFFTDAESKAIYHAVEEYKEAQPDSRIHWHEILKDKDVKRELQPGRSAGDVKNRYRNILNFLRRHEGVAPWELTEKTTDAKGETLTTTTKEKKKVTRTTPLKKSPQQKRREVVRIKGQRVPFSKVESMSLFYAVQDIEEKKGSKCSISWRKILDDDMSFLPCRRPHDLKDRYRNIIKFKQREGQYPWEVNPSSSSSSSSSSAGNETKKEREEKKKRRRRKGHVTITL